MLMGTEAGTHPGIILVHTACVASGVTSLGEGPVPPVVTTRQQPWLSTCDACSHRGEAKALGCGMGLGQGTQEQLAKHENYAQHEHHAPGR
jgi:hypothetical protein